MAIDESNPTALFRATYDADERRRRFCRVMYSMK